MKFLGNVFVLALATFADRAQAACCSGGTDPVGNFYASFTSSGQGNGCNYQYKADYSSAGLTVFLTETCTQGGTTLTQTCTGSGTPDVQITGQLKFYITFTGGADCAARSGNVYMTLSDVASNTWTDSTTGLVYFSNCAGACSPGTPPAPGPAPFPAPVPAPVIGCFSASSQVQVLGQGSVLVKDLQVGDMVLTGKAGYEPIYAFGHQDKDGLSLFVQIHNQGGNNQVLEVTPEHLVFIDGHANPVRADSIKKGDVLLGPNGVASNRVTSLKTISKAGLYNPLTHSGTIIVDGVMASTYISLQDKEASAEHVDINGGFVLGLSHHDFAHMALSPFRLLCNGVSSRVCSVEKDGMPFYVSKGIDFITWVHKQNLVVKGLLFLLVGALFVVSTLLEVSFGPSLAPLAIFVAAIFWQKQKAFRNKVKQV